MNWSKAKSVLIIALLITNMILAGIFFLDRRKVSVYENSKQFANEAKELLKEKNIEVLTDIPTREVTLPSLEVSYETYSTGELNQKFFNGRGLVEKDDINQIVIKEGKSFLSLIDNRRLLYEDESPFKDVQLTLNQAEKVAMDFLVSKEYSIQDLDLVKKEKIDNGWNLVYTKVYNENYVESTYTVFTIQGDQVKQMDRLWIDVIREEETKQPLEPASKAILSLLNKRNLAGRKVKDISPCYFFNPEEQGAVEELTRSLEGKSSSFWRAVLDNGEEVILIDRYVE